MVIFYRLHIMKRIIRIIIVGPGLGAVDGRFAVGNLLDKFLRFVDAVIHAGKNDRLAVKAGRLDILVRRNDDAVADGDFLGRQFSSIRFTLY